MTPSTLNDPGEQVYTVDETDPAAFVVALSNPSQFTVTVEWRTDTAVGPFGTLSDTAATPSPLAGADYTVATGMLTFEPGETNQVITVQHLDDSVDEFDEDYYVDLFNPTYARIDDGRAYGIIADDDAPVSVSIAPQGALPQVVETSFSGV